MYFMTLKTFLGLTIGFDPVQYSVNEQSGSV